MRRAAAEIFMFKIVNKSLSKSYLFITFPPVFDLKIPHFLSYIGLGWFPLSSTSEQKLKFPEFSYLTDSLNWKMVVITPTLLK